LACLKSLHLTAWAAFPAAFLALLPGEAFARYNCGVKKTADGFVALRAAPSPQAKLITRMKPGELVGLLHPPNYDNPVHQGNWTFVRYVPGSNIDKPNGANHDKGIPGWVNNALLNCHE